MAHEKFAAALAKVLVHEGGKVDHPADPGGRTNKGVTQRVYNGWRAKNNLPVRDVYQIADNEVQSIYRLQYWDAIHGDTLPPGIDYVVFDGAVNSGPKQSVKWLQRALGFTGKDVDGVIGSVTLGAVEEHRNHDALVAAIIDRRELFLRALRTFKTFGKGWLRRISSVEDVGQAWAMGNVGPEVVYIPGANEKAVIEDAKKAPPNAPGDAIGGLGLGGGLIGQGIEQLTPFGKINFIQTAIVWLTVAGVVILLAAGAYRAFAMWRKSKLDDALDIA